MDVPPIVVVPPPAFSDRILTPGAVIDTGADGVVMPELSLLIYSVRSLSVIHDMQGISAGV